MKGAERVSPLWMSTGTTSTGSPFILNVQCSSVQSALQVGMEPMREPLVLHWGRGNDGNDSVACHVCGEAVQLRHRWRLYILQIRS